MCSFHILNNKIHPYRKRWLNSRLKWSRKKMKRIKKEIKKISSAGSSRIIISHRLTRWLIKPEKKNIFYGRNCLIRFRSNQINIQSENIHQQNRFRHTQCLTANTRVTCIFILLFVYREKYLEPVTTMVVRVYIYLWTMDIRHTNEKTIKHVADFCFLFFFIVECVQLLAVSAWEDTKQQEKRFFFHAIYIVYNTVCITSKLHGMMILQTVRRRILCLLDIPSIICISIVYLNGRLLSGLKVTFIPVDLVIVGQTKRKQKHETFTFTVIFHDFFFLIESLVWQLANFCINTNAN